MPDPLTNVLLVEDTLSDAEIVRAYLEEDTPSDDFQVIHAACLERALEIMKSVKIHAVMLDLFLPDTEDLTGLDSIRTLLPSVPILILTGRDDEDLAFRAVETGAQDYLLKDKINPKMLKRSLRYAMQRKRCEDRITFQAHYDALTFLPNRQHFKDRLEIALSRQQRTQSLLAVMMVDLDDFKHINDTYGHETGDRVIRETARRLQTCLRPYDIAGRFAGDEFLVLIEDIKQVDHIHAVAMKICDVLSRPFAEPMQEICLTSSVGVVLAAPGTNLSVDILLHRADQAMYMAKKDKKNCYRFFMEEPVAA